MIPTPESLGLPAKQWREGQWQAIENSIKSGKRFVAHNAPVGSGKSNILMGEARHTNQRALFLTGTKPLQNQYGLSFRHLGILDIRGKSNYQCRATELGGEWYDGSPAKSVDQGPCTHGSECGMRALGCVYYDKVREANYKKLVVANYAAYISSNIHTEGWGYFPLVMLDEAHESEEWLIQMLEIHLPRSYMDLLEIQAPHDKSPHGWRDWANKLLPYVRVEVRKGLDSKPKRGGRGMTATKLKSFQQLERILTRLRTITDTWIVLDNDKEVVFNPVWVHMYAEQLLFRGASKVVLASSTIRPHTLNRLGISEEEFDFFDYPSTFPKERRPIYFWPVVKMNKNTTFEENLLMVAIIDSIIEQRLDRKGMIHTVSFQRAKFLLEHSRYANLMITNGTSNGQATLQKFRAAKYPAILVTPSMGTGVDLPFKDCEYTIIPKMPFESPSRVSEERAKTDKFEWVYNAAESVIQYIGRAMRDPKDQNECFILDANFEMFRTRFHKMIPSWIWETVQLIGCLPQPLEALK